MRAMPRSTSPIPRHEFSHERSPEHGHVSVEARRFQGDEKQPAEAISHGRRARALAAGVQPLNMPREFTVAIAT